MYPANRATPQSPKAPPICSLPHYCGLRLKVSYANEADELPAVLRSLMSASGSKKSPSSGGLYASGSRPANQNGRSVQTGSLIRGVHCKCRLGVARDLISGQVAS